MEKIYIGTRTAELYPGLESLPISKVELLDENGDIVGVAGDDTGRVLTAENPDGTNAMAASILASVRGYVYRPYEADDALIDPAAELGDGVTVGGLYSVLANENITFDGLYSSGISAPGTDEIEDEYPYLSENQRIKRSIAATRSLITKTAEEVRLSVEGLNGDVTALTVKMGEVTIYDSKTGSTYIRGSAIETGSITVDKLNIKGAITFGDLAMDVQNDINDAYTMAYYASRDANDAIDTVGAWTYSGSTYIDGSMIMTGTVMASCLLGGHVGLLNRWEDEIGELAIGSSSSSDYAIELKSNCGALRLVAGGGDFWVDAYYGSMGITESGIICGVPPVPQSSGNVSLGTYGFKWSQVYAATGTINTSDRTEKNSIDYDLARYDAMFDGLKPCSYKLNDGTSNRLHVGMISNDVEVALGETGLTSLDFAGFIKSPKDEGGYAYGLRYSEFIALNIWQIQKLKARVAELEAKL